MFADRFEGILVKLLICFGNHVIGSRLRLQLSDGFLLSIQTIRFVKLSIRPHYMQTPFSLYMDHVLCEVENAVETHSTLVA